MKKIMFNDAYGLTAAVLTGKKTMTRRMIPQEFFSLTWDVRDDTLVYENDFGDFIDIRESKYARYKVGEVVAVARPYESIIDFGTYEKLEKARNSAGWNNKMFVKADAMEDRIRITGIRVERLQDISDEDCIKEGIIHLRAFGKYHFDGARCLYLTPREAFAALIDKVSGRGTWASNPWAVAYEYELVK